MNSTHPAISELLLALETNNKKEKDELVSRTSIDNWHGVLGRINRSNARAIHAHLARIEGRNQKEIAPEDLAPIFYRRKLVSGLRQRCEAVAEHFHERMSAPGVRKEGGSSRDVVYNDRMPLSPFVEVLTGEYTPIETVEVMRAIGGLPKRKAPGADTLPAGIRKKTTAVIPYPMEVGNRVLASGHFPKTLRRIYIPAVEKG